MGNGVQRIASGLHHCVRIAWADLVETVWPLRCWLCGENAPASRGALPAACERHDLAEAAAPLDAGLRCPCCAAQLPPGIAGGTRCARCRRRPPSFDRAVCAFDYAAPRAADWVLRFKHGGRPDLALPLAHLMGRALLAAGYGADPRALLIPVPLHVSRRVDRGFDQAALLAGALAGLGFGVRAPLLRRTRATPSQGAAEAASRRLNVRRAFALRPGAGRALAGRVWLVDDVLTSGATASACGQVLRQAGAQSVGVITIARA